MSSRQRSKVYQTGEKYELYVEDRNQGSKIILSIRLKSGVFDPGTNTVGVILDPDMAEDIARDILYRIDA